MAPPIAPQQGLFSQAGSIVGNAVDLFNQAAQLPPVVNRGGMPAPQQPPGPFQQAGAALGRAADRAVDNINDDINAGVSAVQTANQNEGPVGRFFLGITGANNAIFLGGAAANNINRTLRALGF